MNTVLITGAGGYLGGRLVGLLGADPTTAVRAMARSSVPWLDAKQILFDLTSPAAELTRVLDGVDTVVHLAGANEVQAAEDPDRALAETVTASRHVAEAAAAAGVARVVYVSTVHVYGAGLTEDAMVTEASLPLPRAVYAIARLASEYLLSMHDSGPEVVVFRLTNSVGAPADPSVRRWTLVANDLCQQATTTGSLLLRTHGMQWRDFVAMADVCEALRLAVHGEIIGGTYNLGLGQSMTVRDLAGLVQDAVEEQTGTRPPLSAPDAPCRPPRAYTIAVDKLRGEGWTPTHSVAEAIAETVKSCLRWRERA